MVTVDGFVSEMSGGRWAVHSFAHPESVLEGWAGRGAGNLCFKPVGCPQSPLRCIAFSGGLFPLDSAHA